MSEVSSAGCDGVMQAQQHRRKKDGGVSAPVNLSGLFSGDSSSEEEAVKEGESVNQRGKCVSY
jgi:hypothetical protein